MHRLFFVLITLFASNAYSAEVADLYQSQFAVSDQSDQQRQQVAPEVLRQVILKVVGDRTALDTVDLSPILQQTEQLIQQYQYRRTNTISDDLTLPDQLEVLLTFDESRLNQLLTANSLPIWSASRPEVLLWIAVKNGQNKSIFTAGDSENKLSNALSHAVKMRGLPSLLPVMDLQDQNLVSFAELWTARTDKITAASQRYGAQVIVMANVTLSEQGVTQITWQSVINDQSEKWQSRGDIDNAISSGIAELTDRLARRFSQVVTTAGNGQEYQLHIKNVKDFADYARITDYLSNLQYVDDVRVSSVANDEIALFISIKGDLAVFERTLAISHFLYKEPLVDAYNSLHYWLAP